MEVGFLQAAKFDIISRDADGKVVGVKTHSYKLGVHDVPEEVINHHYYGIMKKAGLINEELDEHAKMKPITPMERNMILAERAKKANEAIAAKAKADVVVSKPEVEGVQMEKSVSKKQKGK